MPCPSRFYVSEIGSQRYRERRIIGVSSGQNGGRRHWQCQQCQKLLLMQVAPWINTNNLEYDYIGFGSPLCRSNSYILQCGSCHCHEYDPINLGARRKLHLAVRSLGHVFHIDWSGVNSIPSKHSARRANRRRHLWSNLKYENSRICISMRRLFLPW